MEKIARLDLFRKLKMKRSEIDLIDRKLLVLLNQRLRIALEIGKIKKGLGKKIYGPKREEEVLERLKIKNKGPLREEDLKKIFKAIMSVCRKSQTK
jgi:chorismate mutase